MINWMPSRNENHWVSQLETPVGTLWIVYTGRGIVAADFWDEMPRKFGGQLLAEQPLPEELRSLFLDAMAGRPFRPWAAIDTGFTPLEQKLLSTASEVPFGTTCSYGTLAAWAGYPGRARAAGRAMSRSPIAYLIPTHRVIRADGTAAPCQRDSLNRALRRHEDIDLG